MIRVLADEERARVATLWKYNCGTRRQGSGERRHSGVERIVVPGCDPDRSVGEGLMDGRRQKGGKVGG